MKQISNRKFQSIEENNGRIMLSKNNALFILESDFNIKLLSRFDNINNFTICDDYIWINSTNLVTIYNINTNYNINESKNEFEKTYELTKNNKDQRRIINKVIQEIYDEIIK